MKVKSKVRKLSVQLIGMTVALFVIGTVIGAIVLYKGSRDMYLEAKDEMISYNLRELGNSIESSMHLDWLIDYVNQHDDFNGDLTDEEDSELIDVFPDQYSGEFNDQQFREKVAQIDP